MPKGQLHGPGVVDSITILVLLHFKQLEGKGPVQVAHGFTQGKHSLLI